MSDYRFLEYQMLVFSFLQLQIRFLSLSLSIYTQSFG